MLPVLPHRRWCEKELDFLELGQRLCSSSQVGGVRRAFPHPLSNLYRTGACSAREQRHSGVGRIPGSVRLNDHHEMPQTGTKTKPELAPDSLLLFLIPSCPSPVCRVRANWEGHRVCGIVPGCGIPRPGWTKEIEKKLSFGAARDFTTEENPRLCWEGSRSSNPEKWCKNPSCSWLDSGYRQEEKLWGLKAGRSKTGLEGVSNAPVASS